MNKKTNINVVTLKISAVNANLECLKLLKYVLTGNDVIDEIIQERNRIDLYVDNLISKSVNFGSQIDLQPVWVNHQPLNKNYGRSYYYYYELQIFMDTGKIHAKGNFSGFVDDNDETVSEPFDIDVLKSIDELLESDPLRILDAIKSSRLIM